MKSLSKILLITELFLCSSFLSVYCRTNSGGLLSSGNTFEYKTSLASLRIEFCSATMLRIRISPNGQFQPDEHYVVAKYDWPQINIKQKDEGNYTSLATGKITVRVYKNPLRIALYDKENKKAVNIDKTAASFEGDSVKCTKQLITGEHFFGFGERMDCMDRLGKSVTLNVGRGQNKDNRLGAYNINKANYSPVPFFMSTKGYGLFFHTSYKSNWDMGNSSPDVYEFSAKGSELDYYLIYGPDFKEILNQYTDLTGKSPMLPKVAFGLHVGTYSGGTWGHEQLCSQDYIQLLARRLRNLGVPADVLHFDSTWRLFTQKGGTGATTFEWRKPAFYNPKELLDTLKALHFSYIGLHIRTRFDNSSTFNYLDEAQKLGYTVKEGDKPGEIVDFFNPKAVNWWWEKGLKPLAQLGINFVKTDEGSVFGSRANESNKIGPQGEIALKYHNIFPLVYAKAPFEKFSELNATRGMNHTREGYAGIQKYPFIFAGDWPSEWQYFLPVMRAGINIGVSGVGYWTHCMGGFEQDADPELYIRWCQFGFFSPISHVFGMDHPGYKEPWNYGKEALNNFIKYDRLRYSLFPYIYSSAYELYKTGMPIIRSLVLAYQNDSNVYHIDDQYLFGDNFMVAPIVQKGLKSRTIYLPEGTWFDFWTGTKYQGRQTIDYSAALDQLPLLVKGGSIIPFQPVMNYMGEKEVKTLTFEIFPEGTSSFALYEDDGKSFEYQKGGYALTKINCRETAKDIIINIANPEGNFVSPHHRYEFKLHLAKAPGKITVKAGHSTKNIEIKLAEKDTASTENSFVRENAVLYLNPGIDNSQSAEIDLLK